MRQCLSLGLRSKSVFFYLSLLDTLAAADYQAGKEIDPGKIAKWLTDGGFVIVDGVSLTDDGKAFLHVNLQPGQDEAALFVRFKAFVNAPSALEALIDANLTKLRNFRIRRRTAPLTMTVDIRDDAIAALSQLVMHAYRVDEDL